MPIEKMRKVKKTKGGIQIEEMELREEFKKIML